MAVMGRVKWPPRSPHLHGGFFYFGFFSAGFHPASLLGKVVSLFCYAFEIDRFKKKLPIVSKKSFETKSLQQLFWG